MSKQYYPVREPCVLIITKELACCFEHKRRTYSIYESAADIASSPEMEEFNDVYSHIYPYAYDAACEYIHRLDKGFYYELFTGTVAPVEGNVSKEIKYRDEELLYIMPEREASFFRAVYENLDELAEEFKSRLVKIIPPDFDVKSCIRSIDGVYLR